PYRHMRDALESLPRLSLSLRVIQVFRVLPYDEVGGLKGKKFLGASESKGSEGLRPGLKLFVGLARLRIKILVLCNDHLHQLICTALVSDLPTGMKHVLETFQILPAVET